MVNKIKGKNVLITGGLGFIGSSLAIRLVELGANVTLVDNMLPRQGGNLFNINSIKDEVKINFSDIRDQYSMNHLVQDMDVIFHLAGQVNHIDSLRDPLKDLDINCRGTLVLLEACKCFNKKAKLVFTGTRGQYGPSVKLPVDEDHPMNPKGIYAITNLACEKMILVYNDVYGIRSTCLRITNTFGPRHQMSHDEYGVFNWFIRKAIDEETIRIFGDGRIMRDYLYVSDVVEALILCGIDPKADKQVFNVGTGTPVSFIDLAKKIIEIAGTGDFMFTEFSKERQELEPGDYYADCTKIKKAVSWKPKFSIDKGIKETVEFYRKHKKHYW